MKKICFAASSGGHFEQLKMLEPLMRQYNSFIVTENTSYIVTIPNQKIYYLHQVNRKEWLAPIWMLFNFVKSMQIMIVERPNFMITTGVLAIIPLCLLIKLFGGKLIYIESFAKITSPTKTGRLMYHIADQFYVQWESMKNIYPKAIYLGGIY